MILRNLFLWYYVIHFYDITEFISMILRNHFYDITESFLWYYVIHFYDITEFISMILLMYVTYPLLNHYRSLWRHVASAVTTWPATNYSLTSLISLIPSSLTPLLWIHCYDVTAWCRHRSVAELAAAVKKTKSEGDTQIAQVKKRAQEDIKEAHEKANKTNSLLKPMLKIVKEMSKKYLDLKKEARDFAATIGPAMKQVGIRIYVLVVDYYGVTTLSFLTTLLWRHELASYNTTNAKPATMTSLPPLLWRHYPRYYDVTNPATMTSLTPLLWRHYPRYYDVTNPSTMASPTPLIWRH